MLAAKILIFSFLAVILYALASIGAWYSYPAYAGNLLLLPTILINQGLNAPAPVYLSFLLPIGIIGLLIFGRPKARADYGNARWGNLQTAKNLKLNSTSGVVLGKLAIPNKSKPSRLEQIKHSTATKHELVLEEPLSTLVLAPPGTGKTTAVLIPTLLKSNDSMILHDPKGEIWEVTAGYRSTMSKVLKFAPTYLSATPDEEEKSGGTSEATSAVFNVFCETLIPKDRRDWRAYVNNVALRLIPDDKNGEAFFTENARTVFSFFALSALLTNGKTSLPELRQQIVAKKNIVETVEDIIEQLEDLEQQDELTITALNDGNAVLNMAISENTWGSIISTLTPKIGIFADSRIANATQGRNEISGEALRERTTTVYLIVPDKDRQQLAPVLNLLFQTIGTELISEMPDAFKIRTGKDAKRVRFLIDEFPRLGKMREVVEMPDVARGYGVSVLFVAQDFTQIAEVYGRDRADILASTCSYRVVFQQNSDKAAQLASSLIGKTTVERRSKTVDTKKIAHVQSSANLSDEGIEFITPQVILNMDADKSVVLGKGAFSEPLLSHNMFWFKDKTMKAQVESTQHFKEML